MAGVINRLGWIWVLDLGRRPSGQTGLFWDFGLPLPSGHEHCLYLAPSAQEAFDLSLSPPVLADGFCSVSPQRRPSGAIPNGQVSLDKLLFLWIGLGF